MLRLPRFELIEARSYVDAASLLRAHGAGELDPTRGTPSLRVMTVAGGTDLFPNMKRRQFTPDVLISLQRVDGATALGVDGALQLGAGVTLATLATHPAVVEQWTALALGAAAVSTPQLRNAGTIGGNLCLDTRCNWYDQSLFWRTAEGFCMKTHPEVVCRVAPSSPRCLAVASADTVPALLALGATVRIEGAGGGRDVAVADLYREDGIAFLGIGRDEVLASVTVPAAKGWSSTYQKLRDRGSFDFPIVGIAAAVRFDGGVVAEARVAITAVSSRATLVEGAATALVGSRLDDAAITAAADAVHKAARPMDNTAGTISQRKRTARVFAERAIASLRQH